MVSLREKTIGYRRAEWFDDCQHTLEALVRMAHSKLKDVDERTIAYGAQMVRSVKSKNPATGGVLVHITAETPGEFASLVPKSPKGTTEIDVKAAPPPSDAEWLDGDAFLFVKDEHVCLCANQLSDGAIRSYLWKLFLKAKLGESSTKFDLMKVADIARVKLIQSEGVKELEIRATLYKATANYVRRKGKVAGALGAIGKHLQAVLGKPNDVTPEAMRVSLALRTDARFAKKELVLAETKISTLAKAVIADLEDEDDYVIVTNSGQRITPKEIYMKTKVGIAADGKTVSRDKAWRELTSFFGKLKSAGALET